VDFQSKEMEGKNGQDKKGGKAMKRDWSKFQAKVVVVSSEKQNRTNMGRPCCGGSCIGGNCKAVSKIANIFK